MDNHELIKIQDLLSDDNFLDGDTHKIKYVKSKDYDPALKRDLFLNSPIKWKNDTMELVEVSKTEATAMIVFFENSEDSIEEVLKIVLESIKSSAYKQSKRLESMLDILVYQFGAIAFNLDFSTFFNQLQQEEIILAQNYMSYGRDVHAILIEL